MAERLLVDFDGDRQVTVAALARGRDSETVARLQLVWALDHQALEDLRWYLEDPRNSVNPWRLADCRCVSAWPARTNGSPFLSLDRDRPLLLSDRALCLPATAPRGSTTLHHDFVPGPARSCGTHQPVLPDGRRVLQPPPGLPRVPCCGVRRGTRRAHPGSWAKS